MPSLRVLLGNICNINSISIRRKSRVTPSGRQRWWFVLHDEESTLCALQEKWSSVEIQTSWKLESCYMPIPSPSVSDLPRVASVNNLSPEYTPTSNTSNADAVELTIPQPEPTRTESQTSAQSSSVRVEGDDTFLENNLPLLMQGDC